MCITKFGTLAVFKIDNDRRQVITDNLTRILNDYPQRGLLHGNPFENDTAFLTISRECLYLSRISNNYMTLPQLPHTGRRFKGDITCAVKGVKFSRDGKTITPIVVVTKIVIDCDAQDDNAQFNTAVDALFDAMNETSTVESDEGFSE